MNPRFRSASRRAAWLLPFCALLAAGCASAAAGPASESAAPYPQAPRLPFTAADVEFMSSMIPHHAQAMVMSALVPQRTQRHDIRVLAERIAVSQEDEIAIMRTWLADRDQPVPPADATHHRHRMDGVEHNMLMPGMLTAEELAQLERARDAEFDRLFLTFMIRHHEGALTMVEQLFGSYGAAQDEDVFRFASDVFADQSSEIARMKSMLEDVPPDDD
jgi:uncharacterized protein (DUF305 family)